MIITTVCCGCINTSSTSKEKVPSQSYTPINIPTQKSESLSHPSSTPIASMTIATSNTPTDITQHINDYDGKSIALVGQVIPFSSSKIIYDGLSGIYLEGNVGEIQNGYYQISGIYHANTNSITIQKIQPRDIVPQTVDEGKQSGNSFNVVKVQGLAASPPAKAPVSSFVIFNNDDKNGFYLVISPYKSLLHNFTEAEVVGTLIKTPDLNLGDDFVPADFKGIVYANEITYTNALSTTVQNIIQHPENYAFKRVIIDGIYFLGSSKLGYKKENSNNDPRIHLGVGLLGDEFLPEDQNKLIVTIDPINTDWQIRKGNVTGTVLYPTESILKYFAQKGLNQVKDLKPVLMVEEVSEDVKSVSIDELYNDLFLNQGQKYDGKVVKVTGYALGVNTPVKEIIQNSPGLGTIVKLIPADVNVQGTAIADSPQPMRQLPLAGLNSELIEGRKLIKGKYEFKVVVTRIDNKPMLFLIKKTELPFDYPTNIPTAIPTPIPTTQAWRIPTSVPTTIPTQIPTTQPWWIPTASSTSIQTTQSWLVPTSIPTTLPTPTQTFWTTTPTQTLSPPPAQNQKAMWANGDINPAATPMSYYQDGFTFDHNDRSIGLDLGSPRQISSIDLRNFGRAWSRLNAGYIDIYYSDDNSHYTFYMGTKTYTKNFGNPSINYVRIGNLNIPPSKYIKIHQTRDHDTTDDGDCVTLLDDATGWPRVN